MLKIAKPAVLLSWFLWFCLEIPNWSTNQSPSHLPSNILDSVIWRMIPDLTNQSLTLSLSFSLSHKHHFPEEKKEREREKSIFVWPKGLYLSVQATLTCPFVSWTTISTNGPRLHLQKFPSCESQPSELTLFSGLWGSSCILQKPWFWNLTPLLEREVLFLQGGLLCPLFSQRPISLPGSLTHYFFSEDIS